MQDYLYSILFLGGGILTLYITFKDRKNVKKNLDITYVSHLKGYIGGGILILIGLAMFLKNFL